MCMKCLVASTFYNPFSFMVILKDSCVKCPWSIPESILRIYLRCQLIKGANKMWLAHQENFSTTFNHPTVYQMYLKIVFLQFKNRGTVFSINPITILYNVKLKKIYIIVVSYLIRMVCKACKFESTFAICLLIVKILRDFWLSCTSCRLTSWLQGTDDFFAIYTCTVE